jgi:hypothetical protein
MTTVYTLSNHQSWEKDRGGPGMYGTSYYASLDELGQRARWDEEALKQEAARLDEAMRL